MSTFRLIFHPKIKKDLRTLDKDAARHIVTSLFPALGQGLITGIPLRGRLKGLHKHPFQFKGISYRVVFERDRSRRALYILSVGPRSDFYERLLRRLR